MRKSSRKRDAAGVSLFPFLAVLLCTMGSLIVLLMQIVAQARVQALADLAPPPTTTPAMAPPVAPPVEPPPAYVPPEPEPAVPRIDVAAILAERAERRQAQQNELNALEEALTQLSKQAAEGRQAVGLRRAELDVAAAELRRLHIEAERLAQLEVELERPGAERDRLALAQSAEALRKKVASLTSDVELAKQDAALRKPSFAVIPFTGPNQTRRRPIYIECRVDAIEIRPEGIQFNVEDFRGPMGPGNPLAATVRTIADYYRAEQQARGEYGVPYPLLLVRPNGIVAYYTARDALTVLGTEFGYELIEADWKLDFPPSDPELVNQAIRALEQARRRQRELMAAAPRLYGRPGSGGVGSGSGADSGAFALPPEAMPPAAAGHYPNPNGMAGGKSGSGLGQPGGVRGDRLTKGGAGADLRGGTGGGRAGGLGTGQGAGQGGSPDGHIVRGDYAGGAGSGQGSVGYPGGYPNSGQPGSDGPQLGDGRGNALEGNNTYGQGAAGEGSPTGGPLADSIDQAKHPLRSRRDGSGSGAIGSSPGAGVEASGTSAAASGGAGQTGPTTGPAGAAVRPGSVRPDSPGSRPGLRTGSGEASGQNSEPVFTTDESASISDRPQTAGGQPARPGELRPRSQSFGDAPGGSPQGLPQPANRQQPSPLTRARGQGWAMPEVAKSSIAASRPVVIDCYADRLVLGAKVIPLDTRTDQVVDELLEVVRERVRSWGIAGQGVYWKPELVFRVAPDGASQFVELKQWLDGSGLEVRAVQK